MLKRIFIAVTLIISSFGLYAQSCTMTVSSIKVCHGSTVSFSATFSSGFTPFRYEWDFGNTVKNFQSAPVYNYPAAGVYIPKLKIIFTSGDSCLVTGPTIQVVSKPIANFTILTNNSQCFKDNLVCIRDSSKSGSSGSPLISRLFLWGDGNYLDSALSTKTICHKYQSNFGGLYTLVLEITDSNGCVGRMQKDNVIQIWPKMQDISFTTQFVVKCKATPVKFINTSQLQLSNIRNFRWVFDDSTFDISNSKWDTLTHIYTKGGSFDPSLIVEDKNACRDTFTLIKGAMNMKLDSQIVIKYAQKCFSNQNYEFSAPNAPGALILWRIYSPNGKIFDSIWAIEYLQLNKRFNCGRYAVRMNAGFGNCSTQVDTFVDVYGPNTIIRNDTIAPKNSSQCHPFDTVYLRTPPPELSCFYQNVINRLWDFGDAFAPPCTTDTRKGINVGLNCNFSKDADSVKHKYSNGQDNCYKVKLTMIDTVKGCSDIDSTYLALTTPNAHPDLNANPPRRGLYFYTIPPGPLAPPQTCYTNSFVFRFEETLPSCGREKMWINLDSLEGKWDSLDVTKNFLFHQYNKVKDPNAWVTTGLIVKNGNCYDTAWYHHMFQLLDLKPAFRVKVEGICAPYKVTISLIDSIQDSLVRAQFYFNGIYITQNFSITDSVINSKSFTFNTSGIKTLAVILTNRKGCILNYDTALNLGIFVYMLPSKLPKPIYCKGDSVEFLDQVYYYGYARQFWKDPNRAASGKEQLLWDFGDNSSPPFTISGASPKHKYTKIANYKVRMLAIDSMGCRDTFNYVLKVIGVKAVIAPLTENLACAPKIISFKDQSYEIDSSALYGQLPYDVDTFNIWDFGDGKPYSFLRNPVHDYTSNGLFKVLNVVMTLEGCTDTAFMDVFIKGPNPSYSFLSGDTMGCSPVTLKMKNTTGRQLLNWQWLIAGPQNSVLSTNRDTDVTFTFNLPGIYRILLLGVDTVTNPVTGLTFNCSAVAPDTLNPNTPPTFVYVYDKPLAKLFGPDSVCINTPFYLFSSSDSIYNSYKYDFDDGNSITRTKYKDTVTYLYSTAGNYTIRLIPSSPFSLQCIDTGKVSVTVRDVIADFDFDDSNSPIYKFINKSLYANSYLWSFGQPSSGIFNTSTDENPSHNYNSISDTFKVCLIAIHPAGCTDTICKEIVPASMLIKVPNVFTPNNDGVNDAFDIDIQGYKKYSLQVFNRWGNLVFETDKDGKGNDGINWNGKINNNASECSNGVYYYIFNYKLASELNEKSLHGTITLIRD